MKKVILVFVATALSVLAFSQSDFPASPYEKPHMPDRKPAPMQTIRYADVMWSKQLERTLPLREKMNLPLYFPNNELGKIGSRYSFTALTVSGIRLGYFQAYDAMADGAVPISEADLLGKLGQGVDSLQVEDENGQMQTKVIEKKADFSTIKFLILKEEWIFDKQRSVMDPRIMWVTFLREYEKDGEVRKSLAFKIYYPSAQPLYAKNEVFNQSTDGDQKSFYDVFMKRYFNSFISRETNLYNDREITSYKFGIEQLDEAERVKDFLFKFEHDLWEF